MPSVGILIFFAVVGAVICAKARVPGGAVAFALIALVLFIGTPAGGRGAGLPGMVSDFMTAVGSASEPLTGESGAAG